MIESKAHGFVKGKALEFLVGINFLGIKEIKAFNQDAKAFLKK